MNIYWTYLKSVLRHKWFVFLEGRKLGVPLFFLIIHDWDKFRPGMFIAYARYFGKHPKASEGNFNYWWNLHQKRSKHHWQAWVCLMDDGGQVALRMPGRFWREMVADWKGAGRAYGNSDTASWYLKRIDTKMWLHPETRIYVEQALDISSARIAYFNIQASYEDAKALGLVK